MPFNEWRPPPARDAAHVVTNTIHLARVYAGALLDAQVVCRGRRVDGTPHRACRRIE